MYKLSDFQRQTTEKYIRKADYQHFEILKVMSGYLTSGSNENEEFPSLQMAKQYLFFRFKVPLTGWTSMSNEWISSDYKKKIFRTNNKSNRWHVSGCNDKTFKTRQDAIDWINQQETADV